MGESSPLLIDEVRNRTREEIFDLLASFGFARGSGSWNDVQVAVELLHGGLSPGGEIYRQQAAWIAKYMGLNHD